MQKFTLVPLSKVGQPHVAVNSYAKLQT